ncbi:hypothetical protein ISS37_07875 [candidate division KSB1 bacterium]|nr:hypothetical protein [candidate division KSB1 bacterium]
MAGKISLSFLLVFVFYECTLGLHRTWTVSGRRGGWALVFDPYKSHTSFYQDLVRDRALEIWTEEEGKLYRDLLREVMIPQFMLVEFTLYPLPFWGAWLERDYPRLFNRFHFYSDVNLLRMVSSGYEQPYSLSFFLGDILTFYDILDFQNWKLKYRGKGIIGVVLTVGNQSFLDSWLFKDYWVQLMGKMRGVRVIGSGAGEFSWDFKAGVKLHQKGELPDVLILSFRRRRMDPGAPKFTPGQNCRWEYEMQFPLRDFGPKRPLTKLLLSYGKMFPIHLFWDMQLTLDVGILFERKRTFDRSTGLILADEIVVSQFFVRPSIEF